MGAVIGSSRRQRLEAFLGGERFVLTDVSGKVGLKNMGNSCFMNSGLQCLSHLEPFAAYFLTGKYKEEVNTTNPLGSKGAIARAFADLQQALWQKTSQVHLPSDLRRVLAEAAPHLFEGFEQQDVQEFLAFCLDSLHEDLNRVTERPPTRTDAQEAEEERKFATLSEEAVAAMSWMRYLQHGKSFLVDLFQGQSRSSLTCGVCGHVVRKFEPFLYLSVPVLRGGKMRSVTDAIEKYLEAETLSNNEQWHCSKCKKKVDAQKKMDIWKFPPVLVLHLKRFEFDPRTYQFKKIDSFLKAPMTMDLSSYVASPQREHATYDVVAVADHLGPFGSGHYTASCLVQKAYVKGVQQASQWHHFDDSRVRPMDAEDVVTKNAYVMFLVRRAGEGQTIARQSTSLPEVWPHCVSSRNSLVLDMYFGKGQQSSPRGSPRGSPSGGSPASRHAAAVEPPRGKAGKRAESAVVPSAAQDGAAAYEHRRALNDPEELSKEMDDLVREVRRSLQQSG